MGETLVLPSPTDPPPAPVWWSDQRVPHRESCSGDHRDAGACPSREGTAASRLATAFTSAGMGLIDLFIYVFFQALLRGKTIQGPPEASKI